MWYPGAEPGGGGYIAQRMLAAKNEAHATGATLFFNVAHYALRPWPWILVALASIVVFPTLESMQSAFPHLAPGDIKNDLAYPAMMTLLPAGLRGLVLASLIAAFMSTLSTHLNWGASYVVNDCYKRFFRPQAPERELVRVGRICTILTMIAAGVLALCLSNALQAFRIILQIGAGTGLLFLLRWFWWRINAFSEIAAMTASFLVAMALEFGPMATEFAWVKTEPAWVKIVSGVAVTTAVWLTVTFLTRPSDRETLKHFCRRIHPGGPGWREVVAGDESLRAIRKAKAWDVPRGILSMTIGCITVYSALIATGYWLYGNYVPAGVLTVVATIGATSLPRLGLRQTE